MARGALMFKVTDVTRALKAAIKAGIANPSCRITPDGAITILPSAPSEPKGDDLDAELEAWRAAHGEDRD